MVKVADADLLPEICFLWDDSRFEIKKVTSHGSFESATDPFDLFLIAGFVLQIKQPLQHFDPMMRSFWFPMTLQGSIRMKSKCCPSFLHTSLTWMLFAPVKPMPESHIFHDLQDSYRSSGDWGVSWLELTISYLLVTQTFFPLKISGKGSSSVYVA